jgi:hypothetical protein
MWMMWNVKRLYGLLLIAFFNAWLGGTLNCTPTPTPFLQTTLPIISVGLSDLGNGKSILISCPTGKDAEIRINTPLTLMFLAMPE